VSFSFRRKIHRMLLFLYVYSKINLTITQILFKFPSLGTKPKCNVLFKLYYLLCFKIMLCCKHKNIILRHSHSLNTTTRALIKNKWLALGTCCQTHSVLLNKNFGTKRTEILSRNEILSTELIHVAMDQTVVSQRSVEVTEPRKERDSC